jgi:ABC-2 type transport system permease protein
VTRLVGVEARRYVSRRLVRVLVGLALLGILITGTVMFFTSHRATPAELRAVQRQGEAQRQDALRSCSAGEFGIPESEVPPGMSLEEYCQSLVPAAHEFGPAEDTFHLTTIHDVLLGTNGLLIALFLLLGASFVGAEWHAGTMTTLLTWEPRRVRVILAKIAVAAAMAFIGTIVLQALLGIALTPAAVFRGRTTGADATWFRSVAGLVLRAGAVASIAATIGAALASLGRNTAAALGVAFGYLAIVENLMRGLRPSWAEWFVGENLAAFLVADPFDVATVGHSVAAAGVVLGMYTAALAAAAGVVFIRRDVT